ncbi:hypothetical protein UlMin_006724 [Ulmus minor]
MGRPPCCDKVGIKKGPWTPEEDIILVSYIQEHGPGNWRSVPTNTGLMRCSKSCRLRWTNYLRPGIKRGNFTPHEEGMIIHLQALLGNKWAAIASYLPQRTDNDIKNYWNTHLKKKLKKFQSALDPHMASSDSTTNQFVSSRSTVSERMSLDLTSNRGGHVPISLTLKQSSSSSSTSTYASSTENISRLLEGWMRSSTNSNSNHMIMINNSGEMEQKNSLASGCGGGGVKAEQPEGGCSREFVSHDEFESILSFENMNNNNISSWDRSSTSSDSNPYKDCVVAGENDQEENKKIVPEKNKQRSSENGPTPPLSFLEKWLLDESAAAGDQVEEMMELSPMF